MKKYIKDNIINASLLFSLFVVSVFLGFMVHVAITSANMNSQIESPSVANITQCENLTLIATSDCLINYVKPFYNYTVRSDVPRTINDIKLNGGDCYDYSHLYANLGAGLGFKNEVVVIDTGNNIAHAITILSDSHTYCIIDGLARYCELLKGGK